MIQYAPDKNGKLYLINTLMTPMEKKAYSAWSAAKNRCKNPGCFAFEHYGGRGISVCQKWQDSFQAFLADVGLPPGKEFSIERINVDGNYEPGNVKWALDDEQHRNRRSTRWVDVGGGKKLPMADVARLAGVSISTIFLRLKAGWTGEKLIGGKWASAKHPFNEPVTIDGVTKPAHEWAKQVGLTRLGFRHRMKIGLTGKELLAPAQVSHHEVTIDGVTKGAAEWAAQIPMDISAFRRRLLRGEVGKILLRPAIRGKVLPSQAVCDGI